MVDSRVMARKIEVSLDHFGELKGKYQKNYGDMSKGHGSQFKVALASQTWKNLSKMNNNSDNIYVLNTINL